MKMIINIILGLNQLFQAGARGPMHRRGLIPNRKNSDMKVDKDKLTEIINTSFPSYKVDIMAFNSGVIVIDVFRSGDVVAIQYDGESYIGVSVVPDTKRAGGAGLPQNVFHTVKEFEDYIKRIA
jgi:hypothetical protein